MVKAEAPKIPLFWPAAGETPAAQDFLMKGIGGGEHPGAAPLFDSSTSFWFDKPTPMIGTKTRLRTLS